MQDDKIKMSLIQTIFISQKQARADGFDWPSAQAVIDKVKEELAELTIAINSKDQDSIKDEFGDVLLVMLNLSLHLKLEIEPCLQQSLNKFQTRYKAMLLLSKNQQLDFKTLTLGEKEALWQLIK